MACNCKEMKGFDLVMFKAKQFELKTGKKAAVFIVNKKTPSFTELNNIFNVEGICCYFTTDGEEHLFIKPIDVSKIEVVDEEVVEVVKKKKTPKND